MPPQFSGCATSLRLATPAFRGGWGDQHCGRIQAETEDANMHESCSTKRDRRTREAYAKDINKERERGRERARDRPRERMRKREKERERERGRENESKRERAPSSGSRASR